MNIKNLFKADGWMNFLIGMGRKNIDKSEGTTYALTEHLDQQLLTQLYIGDGLAKKIINLPAQDMTRRWFTVPGDDEGKILKELERIGAQEKVNEAIRWSRLYGGALLVTGFKDGGELSEPVKLENVRGIEWLKVYPSSRVNISSTDFVTEASSPYFDDIEIFRVWSNTGEPMEIHRSRCLVFRQEALPRDHQDGGGAGVVDQKTWYFGTSTIMGVWSRLQHFSSIEKSTVNILLEFVIGVYKLDNLAEMLAEGNEAAVETRMTVIQASKSIINGVLLGENEDFMRNIGSVAGIPDVIDRFMMIISGITGIPVTRLFGRSPAGQNATGTSDLTNYYDGVASEQRNWLTPTIRPLVAGVNNYTAKLPPDDLLVKWEPLEEPTEKEITEMRGKQAETDERYVTMGALAAEEIREMRFEGGYSADMTVEEGVLIPEVEEPEPPPVQQAVVEPKEPPEVEE